ncbi:hypothetical protein EOG09_13600 [Salmonella enterica]|uniref:Regulatory phage protein cox n=2 Tax=Salmonella enterica TaxID=28901 RepID=A0A5X9IL73_SALET|nr:Cox family DNA-binding protein [Salmonella enterica]EAA6773630.1 hypothetical protein [Salmonella enterica subsp. enterica serovar Agona]EBF6576865.1 hypothetical protein [Salmonella enterica subsp. enterica serovar Typhimurium]EBH8227060.1 hypothetical protein [Salmonella enterica subsp. enterica serovar Typhimurium str. UK-1]EBM6563617.1 hypothetical protein [Salmonella enterica subsp. enterica serovar Poona]EBV1882933.1 hypothetical protein [Salmonella enterica subsp. enterica serovar Sa
MNLDDLLIKYPLEGVTTEKFAELLGKSKNAVDMMVKAHKIPFIEIQDPEKPGARTEKLICIEEFNKGIRLAFSKKPKAQRDAWLMWLGL